jgi:hypothetical protein
VPAHPADRNPTNFVMSGEEFVAYSSAWRHCELWPISPNPIPVNYAARAGYLWRKGGGYSVSTHYPTPLPPLVWVSSNAPVASTFGVNDGPWTTNYPGTAVSAMPTNYALGVSLTLTLNITPSSDISAYAVEDRPPHGWTVSQVSHEGRFNPATGVVRWGVFVDNTNRVLSYVATPNSTNAPATATFAGVVSFDGINAPITGQRRAYRNTSQVPARLESVKLLSDGNRLLTFSGEPGTCYTLEGSGDLAEWQPIEVLLNNDGVLQYIDLQTNGTQRFYRALPATEP